MAGAKVLGHSPVAAPQDFALMCAKGPTRNNRLMSANSAPETPALDDRISKSRRVRNAGGISLGGCQPNRVQAKPLMSDLGHSRHFGLGFGFPLFTRKRPICCFTASDARARLNRLVRDYIPTFQQARWRHGAIDFALSMEAGEDTHSFIAGIMIESELGCRIIFALRSCRAACRKRSPPQVPGCPRPTTRIFAPG